MTPTDDKGRALTAVTDSNVLVDIFSAHDVLNAYENQLEMTPMMAYRRERVRDSLLLAMYLHKLKASTYGLPLETVGILVQNAPPDARGLRTTYVQMMNREVASQRRAAEGPRTS